MAGGGDEWDQIEAEGQAARAAAATPRGAATSASPSSYASGGLAMGDDDPFADDAGGASLELDLPVRSQPPRSVPSAPPAMDPPVPSRAPASLQQPSQPPRSTASVPSAPPLPSSVPGPRSLKPSYPATSADPASLIARFPAPPEKVLATPGYALRVLWRQMELRQELETLRKRRSPDVPLFERALRTYDAKTFTLGLLLAGAALAVVTFVVFLPVILRFADN